MVDGTDTQNFAKPLVRSFDVFDTLLARNDRDPTHVFDLVENTGIPNFKATRLKAQSLSDHTWASIYRHYQLLSDLDDQEIDRLKNLEINAEIQTSYLVMDVYNQVRDGDILVSDMYLPAEIIMKILEAIGFQRSVTLFVSPGGKASGEIWPIILQKYKIETHIGDNIHSDVESPRQHGINACHYDATDLAPIEKMLANLGATKTASVLRRFRLSSPFVQDEISQRLYDAQASCNLPFLLLLSTRLNEIMQRENLTRILFSTRDGCLLQPIHETLFPDVESIKFHTSRIAYIESRPSYVKYLRQTYVDGHSIIFDLHGMFSTGRTVFQDIFGTVPRVYIFSGAYGRASEHPNITVDVEKGSHLVELLNLDVVGPLITVSDDGDPIRAPINDQMADIARYYKLIVSYFIENLAPNLEKLRQELSEVCKHVPWDKIHEHICATVNSHPDLRQLQPGEDKSLTSLANENLTDKGNLFACAHCYTYAYEKIFRELAYRSHFSLLEIGLNRDGRLEIPSLETWRSYFGKKVVLYGMDIEQKYFKFHDPSNNVHIIIGDQSKSSDLIKCAQANISGYDCIIDDGYHASKHQQITLKILWQFLKPGGFFVIEDLHYQPFSDDVTNTKEIIRNWKNGTLSSTKYISRHDARKIVDEIDSITFFDSFSVKWPADNTRDALVVLRKRV